MSENESNEIKRTILDINCKYIIIQIFNMLNRNMFLKIMKYNLYLQKMFNVNLSDYKKHLETEIEIIPIDNEKGPIFYIIDNPYCHIYINDNQTETNNFNYLNCGILKKVKLIIEYDFKSIELLFRGCKCIKKINFIKFNRKDIIKTNNMFDSCTRLEELNLANFKTNNVTDMSYMFNECLSLKKLNISNFNTNKVENMMFMFHNCKLLEKLGLSYFNTKCN